MGVRVQRVGERVLVLGTDAVQVSQPRGGAAPWWMAAGVVPWSA